MKTYECPVCGKELMRWAAETPPISGRVRCGLYCSCCAPMNDGAEGTDFPRAYMALCTIADAMDPDERERVKREVQNAEETRKDKIVSVGGAI